LGDPVGPRTMFVVEIAVSTAASAARGFAPALGWLIGFRAVQGLDAAMLMPQTLAILTMVFPPEQRGAALGIWGAVAGLATIADPPLGGLLVTAFNWRWIFFVNPPLGAAVLTVTFIIIPGPAAEPEAPPGHHGRGAGQRGPAGHLLRAAVSVLHRGSQCGHRRPSVSQMNSLKQPSSV
jgi:MFS family permease